jgi:hypothetical protein
MLNGYLLIFFLCFFLGPQLWAKNPQAETPDSIFKDQAIFRIKTEVFFKSDLLVFDQQVSDFYCLLGSSALESFLMRLFSAQWSELKEQERWEALTAIKRLESFVMQQRVVLAKGLDITFKQSIEKSKCFKKKDNEKFNQLFGLMGSEVYLRSRFKFLMGQGTKGEDRAQQQQNLKLFYQSLQKEIPVVWLTR